MKLLERLFAKKVEKNEEKMTAPQVPAARTQPQKTDGEIEKKRRILIEKCMEVLGNQLKVHEKEQALTHCSVSCDFPGTQNKALLRVIPDAADQALCRLTVSAVRKGSDLCVMNYLYKGTRQEMLAWLSAEAHVQELIGYIAHLSESVDEKMG